MARSRNIKPGFFSNELLADLAPIDRLLFVGLWCLADREGRLEDRPKRIKMELLPCDDVDVDRSLSLLAESGFLSRYSVNGKAIIEVLNFAKHQSPHGSERDSVLPDADGYLTVNERVRNVVVSGKSSKVHINEQSVNVKEPLSNGEDNKQERPDSPILRFSDSPIPEDKKPLSPDSDLVELPKASRINYTEVQKAYNEICSPTLPACAVMNEKRKRQIKAMCEIEFMGSKPFLNGLDVWRQYFADCLTNKHWCGGNDRGWTADFDFVTKPVNAIKLMERMN